MAEPLSLEGILARLGGMLAPYDVVDFAVTGGVAVGVWSEPRETRDVDLCAVVPADSIARLLARFDGVPGGGGEIPDVLRLTVGHWDIDVFPAKEPYDHACLDRATIVNIGAATIRVVSREDLLIHKMFKLRSDRRRLLQDAADIRALATTENLDAAYIRKWLPPDEADVLIQTQSLSDEELVKRLGASGQSNRVNTRT